MTTQNPTAAALDLANAREEAYTEERRREQVNHPRLAFVFQNVAQDADDRGDLSDDQVNLLVYVLTWTRVEGYAATCRRLLAAYGHLPLEGA